MGNMCSEEAPKIKLVKELHSDEKAKTYDPNKKTRAVLKHGYFGSHTVTCSNGHGMTGKVAVEAHSLLRPLRCTEGGQECEECGHERLVSDGYYTCKECNDCLCITCSRLQLGMPVVAGDGGNPIDLLPGDILMCWPENLAVNFDSHHAVLITGEITYESEMQELLQLPPGAECWSCRTMESTGLSEGVDTKWTPALSYFARDGQNGTAHLVASTPETGDFNVGDTVEVLQTPIPVKVIMHPLRKEWGGPGLDAACFENVVRKMASVSKKWSVKTCAQALKSSSYSLKIEDYPTSESRAQLLTKLEGSWGKSPICSSLPVMVWQQYFKESSANNDEAVQNMLRYMPAVCNLTTPSKLTKTLTTAEVGWVLNMNFEP